MATYLQGVTDYIPQFQPFQPDLNFYNNVLQTKQTQYDSNYKQLNQVYGQYLYADLTHEDNIQRKEELLKNIDVTLKKVSGLDLSLEKNVTQATQVFKPFYEDQYLMKDMAWTKNYNNQKGRAQGLKNSLDDKIRGQYWEDGVLALDYQREEFKETSIGETLNVASPSYTNYVNVQEKALKLAKDSDLSIESVDFSPDGKWIVKTKNGQQLEEPLSKLFEASLGSDPAVIEMYKTQAYVNRKNFSYSNAAQFGGDKNAAEIKYLENHFNRLKTEQVAQHKQLQDSSNVYKNKIKDIEGQIAKGNKDPRLVQTLNNLRDNNSINENVLNRVQKDIDIMNEGHSSTASTSTGKSNPYGDLKSMRYKIDNAIASSLMEKDLNQAAHIFAYRNAKEDIEANPYAVLDQKHQYDMQNTALRNQGLAHAASIRAKADKEVNMDKSLIESGAYHWDQNPESPTYGRAIMNDELTHTQLRADHSGDVTGALNAKALNQTIRAEKTNTIAVEGVNKMNELIDKYVSSGLMTEEQANHIYGSGANKNIKGISREQFKNQLAKNPDYFLNQHVGSKSLAAITERFNYYMKNNSVVSTMNSDIEAWAPLGQRLSEFSSYQKVNEDYKKKSSKEVEQEMYRTADDELKNLSKYLYDNKGDKLSESAYIELRKKSGAKENVIKRPTQIQIGGKQVTVTNDNLEHVINLAGQDKISQLSKGSWDFQKGANYPQEIQLKNKLKHNSLYIRILNNDNNYVYKEYNANTKKSIIQHLGRRSVFGKVEHNVARTGAYTFKDEYDQLNNLASKAWRSTKISTPPAINTIGVTRNGNNALYTTGITTIGVNHKASQTPGFAYFSQLRNDIENLDFGDHSNVTTSFSGANVSGLSGDTNGKVQTILNGLFTDSENMKSGLPNFTIGAQRIAANDVTKGAMIIYPNREWLKSYMDKGTEENPDGSSTINSTEFEAILRNGISISAKSSNWSNQLFSKGSMSPVEAVIDYNGSYDYTDMYGNGTAKIEKNTYGSSKYKMTFINQMIDPETGEMVQNTSIGYTNDNADNLINGVQDNFVQLNAYNKR